ncbi:GntP family permease [Corynebacterium casei]|uniref:GntP family permease n=2 Tax=Corynebacterium casei TaxID=160386 RepID=UPI003F9A46AB
MVAAHTLIAIVVVVLLIIRFKVDPVISLVLGSLYLGLATGVGLGGTIEAITVGFGEIMIEVGLLIGFGVLIGALMQSTGAFTRLVRVLVHKVGAHRLPYSMALLLSMIMPSIYVDVQVVLAAPVARSAAPALGKRGLPLMASAIGTGIFSGYVFVVPGLAAISITGLMGIPLGNWLMFGLVLGPLTAVLTTFVMKTMLRTKYWKPESDEEVQLDSEFAEVAAGGSGGSETLAGAGSAGDGGVGVGESADESPSKADDLPLIVLFLPILVPLLLIGFGAFAGLFGFANSVIEFFGDANIALFIGLLLAYVLCRATIGSDSTGDSMQSGFGTTGEILLITGVGGSLGAVIGASGLDAVLEDLFTANENMPTIAIILLAWFVAAVLHLAIGSVSVAAIAAAGIIAPIMGAVAVSPIAMGLTIASGALFALQVNSNFFWMFKSLLGLTTKGALKTMTMATTISSVVSLPFVMILATIIPA